MGIRFVQAASAYTGTAVASMTPTINGVRKGSLLVLWWSGANAPGQNVTSVTDNVGGVWRVVGNTSVFYNGSGGFCYAENHPGGNVTLAITTSAAIADGGWSLHEYEGASAQGAYINHDYTRGWKDVLDLKSKLVHTYVPGSLLVGAYFSEHAGEQLDYWRSPWTARTAHDDHYHYTADIIAARTGSFVAEPIRKQAYDDNYSGLAIVAFAPADRRIPYIPLGSRPVNGYYPGGFDADIGAFEFVGGGVVHQGECIESLAFSDVSTRTAIFQAMAVESLALSSITGPQARFQGAALDVLSLSDAGMVQAILRGLASETLVLSDRADRARIISVEIEDTLALSDSAARQATYRATATDTLTLSESIAVSAIYLAAAVELLAFSDASSGDFPAEAIQGECIETLALSATASARLNALATALDRIGLSGSASAILHAAAQAVENLVLSDAAAWGSIIQALAEEHLLLSDEAATTLTMIGQAIETLALSDGALPKMTFQVEATESMAFSDAAATIARFAAVCAETIGFSDMAVHFEPKGMVTITFESKKGSITFSLKKGTITFQ